MAHRKFHIIFILFLMACSAKEKVIIEQEYSLYIGKIEAVISNPEIYLYRENTFLRIYPRVSEEVDSGTILYLPCLKVISDIDIQQHPRSSQKAVEFNTHILKSEIGRKNSIIWQIEEKSIDLEELESKFFSSTFKYSDKCHSFYQP